MKDTVSPVAARFAEALSESRWSNTSARADGMKDLRAAMPGTSDIDMEAFARRLAERTVRRIVPIALGAFGLRIYADRCAMSGTAESAREAALAVWAADPHASYAHQSAVFASYAACGLSVSYSAMSADCAAACDDADNVLRISARLATEILAAMRA
jgi:hypothetical protein